MSTVPQETDLQTFAALVSEIRAALTAAVPNASSSSTEDATAIDDAYVAAAGAYTAHISAVLMQVVPPPPRGPGIVPNPLFNHLRELLRVIHDVNPNTASAP